MKFSIRPLLSLLAVTTVISPDLLAQEITHTKIEAFIDQNIQACNEALFYAAKTRKINAYTTNGFEEVFDSTELAILGRREDLRIKPLSDTTFDIRDTISFANFDPKTDFRGLRFCYEMQPQNTIKILGLSPMDRLLVSGGIDLGLHDMFWVKWEDALGILSADQSRKLELLIQQHLEIHGYGVHSEDWLSDASAEEKALYYADESIIHPNIFSQAFENNTIAIQSYYTAGLLSKALHHFADQQEKGELKAFALFLDPELRNPSKRPSYDFGSTVKVSIPDPEDSLFVSYIDTSIFIVRSFDALYHFSLLGQGNRRIIDFTIKMVPGQPDRHIYMSWDRARTLLKPSDVEVLEWIFANVR